MFDNLSDNARQLLRQTNIEAQRLNHEYICSGHLLLALVNFQGSRACAVLQEMGLNLQSIRSETEKVLRCGVPKVVSDKLPQSPSAQNVMRYALEESKRMEMNYVNMEHFLIGLHLEVDGDAHKVLALLGFELERARKMIAIACQPSVCAHCDVLTLEGRQALADLTAFMKADNPSDAIAAALEGLMLKPVTVQS